jgi:hypothetical protein
LIALHRYTSFIASLYFKLRLCCYQQTVNDAQNVVCERSEALFHEIPKNSEAKKKIDVRDGDLGGCGIPKLVILTVFFFRYSFFEA